MVNCLGCLRVFSHSGYVYHVRHTTNSNCVAEFNRQVNSTNNRNNDEYMDDDERMDGDNERMDNDDERVTPDQFTGDFFGEYRGQDFEWPLESDISRYSIKITNVKLSQLTTF
jgi:hypothetical protein